MVSEKTVTHKTLEPGRNNAFEEYKKATLSSRINPFGHSFKIAGSYLLISLLYIKYSGEIALRLADSAENLQEIEKYKGFAFVFITGLLLFLLCYWLFKKKSNYEARLGIYRDVLLKSERRAATGLFASTLVHDINNILFALENIDFNHAEQKSADHLQEQLETHNLCIKKLAELVTLLSQVRGSHLKTQHELFDLSAVIKDTVKILKNHRKLKNVSIRLNIPDSLSMSGCAIELHQMLLNLIINAADSIRESENKNSPLIEIILKSSSDSKEKPVALLEVHDNGPGIPLKEQSKIFDPFYTTKSSGSGLGLVSVAACVEKHNGHILVHDSHLGGCCFRIEINVI